MTRLVRVLINLVIRWCVRLIDRCVRRLKVRESEVGPLKPLPKFRYLITIPTICLLIGAAVVQLKHNGCPPTKRSVECALELGKWRVDVSNIRVDVAKET